MSGTKFNNLKDAQQRAYRDDPQVNNLTEQAVTDQVTHSKLDDILGALGGGQNVINEFNEVSSVASATETTIVTYTVPAGNTFNLFLIEAGGQNIADYKLFIDGTPQGVKRTYFGGSLYIELDFTPGLTLQAGTAITLKVTHDRPESADFDGRILGVLR